MGPFLAYWQYWMEGSSLVVEIFAKGRLSATPSLNFKNLILWPGIAKSVEYPVEHVFLFYRYIDVCSFCWYNSFFILKHLGAVNQNLRIVRKGSNDAVQFPLTWFWTRITLNILSIVLKDFQMIQPLQISRRGCSFNMNVWNSSGARVIDIVNQFNLCEKLAVSKNVAHRRSKIPVLDDEVVDQDTAKRGTWQNARSRLKAPSQSRDFFTYILLKHDTFRKLDALIGEWWWRFARKTIISPIHTIYI